MKLVKSKKMVSIYGQNVIHFGQKKRSMNLVCMSGVVPGHLLWQLMKNIQCKLLHFFTHETSWISCIFLIWACKPFNGLLANVKPLSLTIQAIPTETKSRKMKKEKKKRKTRYSTSLNSSTIKRYLISVILSTTLFFLITQIPSQQCHAGDSLGTRVLFRTQFCGTRVLKKW